jgi:copper chaperone NosL
MGAEEPVPFGTEEAAETFAEEHGGEVVDFEGVPEGYILGPTSEPPEMQPAMPGMAEGHKGHEMPGVASPAN